MSGAAPEAVAETAPGEVARLQRSFRVFNQVTQDLEKAYSRLENRASLVDGRLQEANRRLKDRVCELSQVSAELEGILNAIPCGVVTCDAAGSVSRTNLAAERILGRSAQEVIGRDTRALLGACGEPILILGRTDAEVGVTVERKVCCLDGAVRYLSGSVADLPDGGRLEIVSDQTELAHLRAQINRLDTLAALGEMAAGVAHEIRNPMNGVEGFAGLLEKAARSEGDGPSRDTVRRYAGRIRRGVAEVDGIISNLLLWAKPERGQFSPVALDELVREVEEEVTRSQVGPRCRLEVVIAPGLPVARGDRLKLKLAIANLVRNAVEAAGTGGRVRIGVVPEGAGQRVDVDDDGAGVAPEVRLRLFRPFATTKASGTGLGLAIARKMVELHGGEILLGDSPLGGARFSVVLPGPATRGDVA